MKRLLTTIFLLSALLCSCGTGKEKPLPAGPETVSPAQLMPPDSVTAVSPAEPAPSAPSATASTVSPAEPVPAAPTPAVSDAAITPSSAPTPEPLESSASPGQTDSPSDSAVPMGDWASILVNPSHYLPDDFEITLADFEGGQVDSRILGVCRKMFSDAERDGISLILVDAYRTYDRQNELYQNKVESFIKKGYSRTDAENEAATITARPNTSEHQTGLALDIVTSAYKIRDEGFSNTDAYRWLDENAHLYGFTLRYKKDGQSVTKVIYEPWHWRFVGVEAAAAMKESGQCYEEYLGED